MESALGPPELVRQVAESIAETLADKSKSQDYSIYDFLDADTFPDVGDIKLFDLLDMIYD
jgi:hypothetical protein